MYIRKMTIDDVQYLNLPENWMRERYEYYLSSGSKPAWIQIDDDNKPLCAFGAAFLWDGVCEVWFNLISKKRGIRQILAAKKFLKEQSKKYGVWRIHATIKCDYEVGKKFVEALGFKYECTLEKYNPDKSDSYLYKRIEIEQ